MNEAIGSILPTAVAVALSPIPIVAVIVMLGTPRAKTNGPTFALGWIVGVSVVMAVVLVVLGGGDVSGTTEGSVRWGTLVLGLVMLWLAVGQWRKRPRPGESATLPAWVSQVNAFTPPKSLGAGVLLSAVNPKNLALTLAASGAIATAGLDDTQELWAALTFVAIASSSVVALVVVALIAPSATSRPLAAVREFMTVHSSAIMAVILLLLGVKLVGDAIGW